MTHRSSWSDASSGAGSLVREVRSEKFSSEKFNSEGVPVLEVNSEGVPALEVNSARFSILLQRGSVFYYREVQYSNSARFSIKFREV